MRISRFLQTPFISYDDKNMIYIQVADWDMCNPYEVNIFVDGEAVFNKKVFAAEFSAMLPCYDEKCVSVVRITPFEDNPTESEFVIVPQKHWEIPLLYSSHEDLGYCAYIEKLHFECYEYLKKAMELCQKHDGFKYMIEHYWWLDAFDFYATDAEKALLKKLMHEKKIDLNAVHSGVHTSWANSEHLVREMYFGCREAKEKYGISPKCAFYVDISGASWSVVNAYAQMGIKYVGIFPNNFRNCQANESIPPLFWWEDKSGNERVLLWYQRAYRQYGLDGIWCDTLRQYPEGEFYFDTTKTVKTEKWFSERISKLEPCEYDILPISFYDDRELPTTMLLTVCEEMNKKWKYPKFTMEIPSVFMAKLEEKYGDSIPTLKGDISDQWADFATISPELTSKKRKAMRMLYDAEMLSTLDSIANKSSYDSKAYRDIYFKLSEFDEHCWATSSKHPQKMHRYNIEKVKRETVEHSNSVLEKILSAICSEAQSEQVGVTSTIPQKRKSRIYLEATELIPSGLNHQILPSGAVITEAVEFDGIESKSFKAITPYKNSVRIEAELLETDFYKIAVNNQTKKIVSIIDKKTGKEYLDKQSRFELGQFVYAYTEQKTDPNLSFEIPKKTDFEIYDGDIAYVLVQKGYEEQSGAVTTSQFVFYKHDRTIDVDLKYEHATGLIGDFYDRYKKNYFFAFPFSLSNPKFYTELPAGEKNENTEYVPLNANDFTVTQNWVSVEDGNHGVAIYTRDMPVFHLGSIKFNCFKNGFAEDKAHVFLYASSNRCNNLIYTSIDECKASYHLSLITYSGDRCEVVPKWSNENEHSLIVGKPIFDGKLIKLSEENVKLVSLKKSEDDKNAIVLRFVETAGKSTECKLDIFFKPSKITYVSNDERELEKINASGSKVSFNCKPYSYTTIKIFGDFEINSK